MAPYKDSVPDGFGSLASAIFLLWWHGGRGNSTFKVNAIRAAVSKTPEHRTGTSLSRDAVEEGDIISCTCKLTVTLSSCSVTPGVTVLRTVVPFRPYCLPQRHGMKDTIILVSRPGSQLKTYNIAKASDSETCEEPKSTHSSYSGVKHKHPLRALRRMLGNILVMVLLCHSSSTGFSVLHKETW